MVWMCTCSSARRLTARLGRLALWAGALGIAACSGGGPSAGSGAARSYLLSAAAVQAVPGSEPFFQQHAGGANPYSELAADVDVVTVFLEHYGVPWDEFAAGSPPAAGHPWRTAIDRFAAAARATGKPLSLQLLLARRDLAGRAEDNAGALRVNTSWAAACFDFANPVDGAKYRAAYSNYAAFMTGLFRPRYLVHAVEVSKYASDCGTGAAWQALVATANDAYDAAKAVDPGVIAMPSLILADLYQNTLDGFDTALYTAHAGMKRDRLGVSAYPYTVAVPQRPGALAAPADLPADFFTRARGRNPAEQAIIVTETGWNSSAIAAGATAASCVNLVPNTEQDALAYLEVLAAQAQANGIELVTWWSSRDLLPAAVMTACQPQAAPPDFAACAGDAFCVANNLFRAGAPGNPVLGDLAFKVFGAMGLRSYDGVAKPGGLFARWKELQAQ